MIYKFEWIGKLVSVDKWHTLRVRPDKVYRKIVYTIGNTMEYSQLINDLIWCIRAAGPVKTIYDYVDMILVTTRWKMADTGNEEKPISDALQHSGILKNDRQIRHKFLVRHYHEKSKDDSIIVELYNVDGSVFDRLSELSREE